MAYRLDRHLGPSPDELVEHDDAAMAHRYRWLAMYGMAADPPWPMSALIIIERDRLDTTGAPIRQKLAALERFLAERDLLVPAGSFAERFPYRPHPKG